MLVGQNKSRSLWHWKDDLKDETWYINKPVSPSYDRFEENKDALVNRGTLNGIYFVNEHLKEAVYGRFISFLSFI